ncbi:SemiSWEET family transporter [Nocardioides abyssi]|uniref:SemiSWEET family transporter n=1 Tax=Nocardioides abyssi TaxID=3058370 RepID=A0ABT8ET40_9ACTN|nr:SemiSWEET family transporter [Nocardioides abyssi]MDN4161326.1 SemiSWEET family transporter [Nocardioides abyssi]
MPLELTSLIGLAATLLAFGYTVPQFRKLRRTASAAGVSVAALGCSSISNVAWTAYGTLERDVWVALPAAVSIPATAGALVLAWHRGGSRERLWLPFVWGAVVSTAAVSALWIGQGPVTVVLGCSVALLVTPAALTAWRSHDVTAIAVTGWVMLVVDALLAGAYGVLAGVEANVIYAAVATTGSLAILLRVGIPPHVHARLVRLPAPVAPGGVTGGVTGPVTSAVTADELSLVA